MAITFDWTNCCLLCDTPKQSEEGKLPEYPISVVQKCFVFEAYAFQKSVEIYAFQKSGGLYNPWGPVLHEIW